MNKQNIIKNSFIAVVVVVIIFLAYKFLIPTKKDKNTNVQTTTQGAMSPVSINPTGMNTLASSTINIQDVDLLRRKLDNIKVDTKIFSENDFSSLEDYRKTIPAEPVGRENPFAKI